MSISSQVKKELRSRSSPEKAKILMRFFKTGKGEYGEGDKFHGVKVPEQRSIAKKFGKEAKLKDISELLDSAYHEERLTGLIMLVDRFEKDLKKGSKEDARQWVDLYLQKLHRVNNWDLVDSSAPQILGRWLEDKDRSILYAFALDKDLWRNRVAIVATMHFIRQGDLEDILKLSRMLLHHKHDLIHKAVGWMLREAWQKDPSRIEKLLKEWAAGMPRTMLRYAIEKMAESKRKRFLEI